MAKLNIEFMDDDMGFCSKVEDDLENSIEKWIRQYPAVDLPWDSLNKEEFEQLYPDRGFLLAWYPFKEDAEILEIGAGVGAITGLLCRKAGKVVAVEKKRRRARILAERYKGVSNLEVLQEHYMKLPYQERFDYIVVHDIFGYVKKYIKTEAPYESFLHQLLSMLKEDGIILLATENRLGMKYFSGAIENYSNKFFVGLDQFDGYDVIYTPTKEELKSLLQKCGITNYKFYYPFPDNIFPTEIYTDRSLEYLLYGGKSEETGWDRFELFNEREMFESLQREGIVQNFVNAFLVEIGRQGNLSKVDYSRLITGRKDGSFQYTFIANGEYHDSNHKTYLLKNGAVSLHKKLSDLILKARYAGKYADQYGQKIYDSFKQVKELLEERGEYERHIYSEDFTSHFGDARVKDTGKCIGFCDINIKNIFCQKETYQIFLEENTCKVPVAYLIWLIMYEWYTNNIWERKSRMKLVQLKKMYDICDLKKEDIDVFQKWRSHYRNRLSIGRVAEQYVDWYKQDFIYPVDAIVNGDLIRRDFSKTEEQDNPLLVEKDVLDEIR